jgi:hypothetical protein
MFSNFGPGLNLSIRVIQDDSDFPDDQELAADSALDTEAEVTCPHCGETITIALDPAGGRAQDYVEDCEVCCRPWRVRVWYDAAGSADIELQPVE